MTWIDLLKHLNMLGVLGTDEILSIHLDFFPEFSTCKIISEPEKDGWVILQKGNYKK